MFKSSIKTASFVLCCAIFSSCESVTPIKNQITPFAGDSVTYVFEKPATVNDLYFNEYKNTNYLQYTNTVENMGVKVSKNQTGLLVTRYINNGVGEGTVNEYRVKVSVVGNAITLSPYENRKNQGGLVLPFPIPVFEGSDLNRFLSATQHKFSFEIDSKFPSESVNANFKRLASRDFSKISSTDKIFENSYYIGIEDADVRVDVTTYPYREGSKCTISVVYFTKQTKSNNIVLKEIEEKIRSKIASIVNA